METRLTSLVLLRLICCLVLMAGTIFFLPYQAPVFGQSSKKIVPKESLQRGGCLDSDGDTICNDVDNCPDDSNNDQADFDDDGEGDACDLDDDNDGVDDIDDSQPFNPLSCQDLDGDGCDDCSQTGQGNSPDPGNDGSDVDFDGVCDESDICDGDDSTGDTDGDGVCDDNDFCNGDDLSGDGDLDGICDDIDLCDGDDAEGDLDEDGTCDDLDEDDDGDGVNDEIDNFPFDNFLCRDSDGDGCDDCSSGTWDNQNDGPDADLDGICDNADMCDGDDATGDTDGDGICNDLDLCNGDDATGDIDGDGVCDDIDFCDGDDAFGDTDIDGVCDDIDMCEGDDTTGDTDGDGVCNNYDVCDGDDSTFDYDGDGICNDLDVCDYAVDGITNFDEENCHCDLGYYAVYTFGEVNGQTTRGEVPSIILGCQQCVPGYYCPDGFNSYACPAGTYGDVPGLIVCNDCDEGYGSFVGAIVCSEAIDCEVSEWSEWEECVPFFECLGLRSRTREIITMPNEFGTPCPPDLLEFEVCDVCSCEDGIMNGEEVGVDCGGPSCPPCNPPDASCGVITVYVDPNSFNYDGPGSSNIWLIPGIDLDAGSTSDDDDPLLQVKRYLSNITFNWTTNGACMDVMPNMVTNNPDKGIVYRDCYPAIPADVNKNKLYRLQISDDFGSDECTGTVKVLHYTPTSAAPVPSIHFVIPNNDEYFSMTRPQLQLLDDDFRTVRDLIAIPNPGSDHLRLSWDADTDGDVTIRIIDMSGRLVVSQQYVVMSGQNSVMFDMDAQPSGVYAILVQTAGEVVNTKWVKE